MGSEQGKLASAFEECSFSGTQSRAGVRRDSGLLASYNKPRTGMPGSVAK